MSLHLHRVTASEENPDEQLFMFSLEQVHTLKDMKSVEGEEFCYGGHLWSVVCGVKNKSLGLYLKLKNQSSCISVKTRFSISLLNHHQSSSHASFSSSLQQFSSKQPLFGKSKVLPLERLLEPSSGFVDSTGKRALIELKLSESCTRFQIIIDTSPRNRTKKNPNGVYFDSNSFHFLNHRWFLRFYLKKLNNNGLPAIYLYLQDGSPHSVTLQLQFILFLATQATELLNYDFGDGARYDGFGKTLPEAIEHADRLSEVEVAVDIVSMCVYKFVPIHIHRSSTTSAPTKHHPSYSGRNLFSPRAGSPYHRPSSSRSTSPHRISQLSEAPNQIFQDHLGNQWRLNFSRTTFLPTSINLSFDQGIYHYPNNRTTIISLLCHIMSHDLSVSKDLHSNNNTPITAYFSNFTDDKGYLLNFPVEFSQLSTRPNSFLNSNEEIVLRVDFLSVQTTSFSERSGPKYDSLLKQLSAFRQGTEENKTNDLSSMKEMSISRGSLSALEDLPLSISSASSGIGNTLSPLNGDLSTDSFKVLSSLNASSTNETPRKNSCNADDFIKSFIQNLSLRPTSDSMNASTNDQTSKDNSNSRQLSSAKKSSLKGPASKSSSVESCDLRYDEFMDEVTLLRLSSADPSVELTHKQHVDKIVSALKSKLPFSVKDVVLMGSLGTNTTCHSRSDADITIVCSDLPTVNHHAWLPVLIDTLAQSMRKELNRLEITTINTSMFSLELKCVGGLEVLVTLVGGGQSGTKELFEESVRLKKELSTEALKEVLVCMEASTAHLRRRFYDEVDEQVKAYIKVVKGWRDSVQWMVKEHRPNSHLLSLLTIKAYQLTENKSLFKVLQKINLLVQEPELKMSWDKFYEADAFRLTWDPPAPLVLDPANPAINVASSLQYWGQFRKELINWLSKMKLNLY